MQEVNRISHILAKLDAVLPQQVSETLRPGASEEELDALAQTVFGGGSVPAALRVFFQWHNGQEWNSLLSHSSNRRLLQIGEIIDEWSFFADPMSDFLEPWRTSWVPLLTNDSGDSLVYESAGEHSGKLIAYWHDDVRRPIEYQSLAAWANVLLSEYQRCT